MNFLRIDDERIKLEGVVKVMPSFQDYFIVVFALYQRKESVFYEEVKDSLNIWTVLLKNG